MEHNSRLGRSTAVAAPIANEAADVPSDGADGSAPASADGSAPANAVVSASGSAVGSEPARADDSIAAHDPLAASTAVPADGALRDELAKWRERVPRLAAALRQRGEETEALKRELEHLRKLSEPGSQPSAGIRARDDLIAELEDKLAELSVRHKGVLGDLHCRQLEVAELKEDLQAWKVKWQSLTRALDDQAAAASDRDQRTRGLRDDNADLHRRLSELETAHQAVQRSLDEAVEERDTLRRRNEQLFETTELANRQIGSLTDSLADLRATLQQQREREAELNAELESRAAEARALEAAAADRTRALADARDAQRAAEEQRHTLHSRLQVALTAGASAERELAALTEELHLQSKAALAGAYCATATEARLRDAERDRQDAQGQVTRLERECAELQRAFEAQGAEVARLTEVVAVAQRTTGQREHERRVLSERLQTVQSRNEHLEQQLKERSELVVSLEQDQAAAQTEQRRLQRQRDELEDSLIRAQRHAKEYADHVTQLDGKLQRQQELMDSLEQELAEAQEQNGRAARSRQAEAAADPAEVDRLKAQVRRLEALVRERTDALNRREAPQQPAPEPSIDPPGTPEGQSCDAAPARARGEDLVTRLRDLETACTTAPRAGEDRPGDDLTRIHGVGDKLAEHLNQLGIHRYQQIAELDEAALADQRHVLHGHRKRILRDRWIDQAVRLVSH